MDLNQRIIDSGKKIVDTIISEGKEEAIRRKKEIIADIKEDTALKISYVKEDINAEIKTKERLLTFERRQALLSLKQDILKNIFSEVLNRLNSLEDNDLLEYVKSQIKNEDIIGDEVIYVAKKDFDKYQKALSSETKNEIIKTDKLNKLLNTSFTLSNKAVKIKGGFILESKDFNLNFDTDEVIDKLKKQFERKIINELFE